MTSISEEKWQEFIAEGWNEFSRCQHKSEIFFPRVFVVRRLQEHPQQNSSNRDGHKIIAVQLMEYLEYDWWWPGVAAWYLFSIKTLNFLSFCFGKRNSIITCCSLSSLSPSPVFLSLSLFTQIVMKQTLRQAQGIYDAFSFTLSLLSKNYPFDQANARRQLGHILLSNQSWLGASWEGYWNKRFLTNFASSKCIVYS